MRAEGAGVQHRDVAEPGEAAFGLSPHTDGSYFTLLPREELESLKAILDEQLRVTYASLALTALLIGIVDTFGKVLLPQAAGVLVYVLMALILLWKPRGLFAAG